MLARREVTLLKPLNEIQADSDGGNKIWPFADLRVDELNPPSVVGGEGLFLQLSKGDVK